jgi:hypothetical protein
MKTKKIRKIGPAFGIVGKVSMRKGPYQSIFVKFTDLRFLSSPY